MGFTHCGVIWILLLIFLAKSDQNVANEESTFEGRGFPAPAVYQGFSWRILHVIVMLRFHYPGCI